VKAMKERCFCMKSEKNRRERRNAKQRSKTKQATSSSTRLSLSPPLHPSSLCSVLPRHLHPPPNLHLYPTVPPLLLFLPFAATSQPSRASSPPCRRAGRAHNSRSSLSCCFRSMKIWEGGSDGEGSTFVVWGG